MNEIPAAAVWIVGGVAAALVIIAAINAWVVPYVQSILP